jgi:hypothetical protein
MTRHFYTIDVVTGQILAGNPLAVLLDAQGLDDQRMQAIAREFNLSETVFVAAPAQSRNRVSLRIFTPTREVPFAGHPASVYFTANTATSGGLITRTSGSWIADGYAPGQLIEITGSATDSTSQDVPDLITAVTATTITLATEDLIFAEATPGASETVSITRGISPEPAAIQIDQVNPVTVNATRLISITAADDVYLDSDVDVRLNQVVAGTTTIGSQIQIKGEGSILNGASTSTVNLQGGDIVLEAAGLNGDPGTIGTETSSVNVGSIGNGTVTARAEGVVNIADVPVRESAGNLNLETVFSATGDAILSAAGSIVAALDNGFTTIQADNVVLAAYNGTIGNTVSGSINYIYLDAGSDDWPDHLGPVHRSDRWRQRYDHRRQRKRHHHRWQRHQQHHRADRQQHHYRRQWRADLHRRLPQHG